MSEGIASLLVRAACGPDLVVQSLPAVSRTGRSPSSAKRRTDTPCVRWNVFLTNVSEMRSMMLSLVSMRAFGLGDGTQCLTIGRALHE